MNVENIKKVRDHIAGLPPERFNMSRYIINRGAGDPREDMEHPSFVLHDCGTAACIAGWTCALLSPPKKIMVGSYPAMALLGIDEDLACDLFMPNGFAERTYVPAQAVAVLDHLLTTGEVDWSVADQVPA